MNKTAFSLINGRRKYGSKQKWPLYLFLLLTPLLLLIPYLISTPLPANAAKWKLSWSDEFNGPAGTSVDAKKWMHETGDNGWGNNELENYTDKPENSFQDGNGNLVIKVIKDNKGNYTSARLKTEGLFTQTYGRFEARIQIPYGQGIWPAFWMLGDNISGDGWPAAGEIDIMENIGKEPGTLHGTLHGPGYSGCCGIKGNYDLPGGKKLADDFHLYAIEWEPKAIRFYLDDHLYKTSTPDDLPAGTHWVYDHPCFMIMNVAVGGNWPGDPDKTTVFPQEMKVDYVRVYTDADATPTPIPTHRPTPPPAPTSTVVPTPEPSGNLRMKGFSSAIFQFVRNWSAWGGKNGGSPTTGATPGS